MLNLFNFKIPFINALSRITCDCGATGSVEGKLPQLPAACSAPFRIKAKALMNLLRLFQVPAALGK